MATAERVPWPWWAYESVVLDSQVWAGQYAERSDVAVEVLAQYGRFPEPCDCDAPECDGWQMGHQWEDAIVMDALR